jgi:hypothetical protein
MNASRVSATDCYFVGRGKCFGALVSMMLFVAALASPVTRADTDADLKAVSTCIDQHFTAGDASTMGRSLALVLIDEVSNSEDLQEAVAGKREAIITGIE